MRKKLLLFVVTIFVSCFLLQAQQVLKPGPPEQNHFSAERLQKIDKLVRSCKL